MKKIRKLRFWKYFVAFLSFLASYGPMFAMIIYSFIIGSPGQKFSLGFMIMFGLILIFLQWKSKHKCRSLLWLVLVAVYFIIDNIIVWLLIVAGCTVLDELILDPIYHSLDKKLERVLTAKAVYDYTD